MVLYILNNGQCQGRTGFKNRPGKFPDDFPPYWPSPARAKSLKNSEITFHPLKMTVFLLPPYQATGYCPNAGMTSPPLGNAQVLGFRLSNSQFQNPKPIGSFEAHAVSKYSDP